MYEVVVNASGDFPGDETIFANTVGDAVAALLREMRIAHAEHLVPLPNLGTTADDALDCLNRKMPYHLTVGHLHHSVEWLG